jgi:cupin 2 domain-containing protein
MPPFRTIESGSLGRDLPRRSLPEELKHVLVDRPPLSIERIISTGQITPSTQWYDQERDEFVLLVAGAARLLIEDEAQERVLAPGDWILLPAHCRHRVTFTQAEPPTIWLAIHF